MRIKDLYVDRAAPPAAPETVHDLDKSIIDDEVNLASAESMDASDPPSFNPGTAAPTAEPPAQDARIRPDRPISPTGPAARP